jgi:hypothetical protein
MDIYTRVIMVMTIVCDYGYWLLAMDIYIKVIMTMIISYGYLLI